MGDQPSSTVLILCEDGRLSDLESQSPHQQSKYELVIHPPVQIPAIYDNVLSQSVSRTLSLTGRRIVGRRTLCVEIPGISALVGEGGSDLRSTAAVRVLNIGRH
jgi:hypothetical protein